MSIPNTSLVKWVSSYQIGIHKSEDCEVPIIPLADLTELVEGLMKERCYSNTVYNGALDDLRAQLEAHRKGVENDER